MKRTTLLLVLCGPVALAGCGGINQEAGAFLDGGTFGNAHMHNMLVSTCQATNHDKYSNGQCAPRELDGEYARRTHETYEGSAREIPRIITSFRGRSTSTAGGGA